MMGAIAKGDKAQTLRAADDLQKDFARTPYAPMSSLIAARITADAGDTAKALDYLRWAAKNASNDGYLGLAKIRLVSQLIEQGTEKDFAEADQILKDKPVAGFEALWLERRGDWYLAQKKITDAKASYQEAWKKLDQTKEFPEEARRLLKVKLDAVGGVAQ
jgi:predicted negative regulator of RcsB-dependent stress response